MTIAEFLATLPLSDAEKQSLIVPLFLNRTTDDTGICLIAFAPDHATHLMRMMAKARRKGWNPL